MNSCWRGVELFCIFFFFYHRYPGEEPRLYGGESEDDQHSVGSLVGKAWNPEPEKDGESELKGRRTRPKKRFTHIRTRYTKNTSFLVYLEVLTLNLVSGDFHVALSILPASARFSIPDSFLYLCSTLIRFPSLFHFVITLVSRSIPAPPSIVVIYPAPFRCKKSPVLFQRGFDRTGNACYY